MMTLSYAALHNFIIVRVVTLTELHQNNTFKLCFLLHVSYTLILNYTLIFFLTKENDDTG